MAIADDIRQERRRLVATLQAVGPHASTLVESWEAADVASHVAAQDRLGGWPAYVARTTVGLTGLRLSRLYLDRPRVARIVNGPMRAWSTSLEVLGRPPPSSVLRPRVARLTLWEHFIHHEDVRRPNRAPRAHLPDLEPVLDWILGYNTKRLTRGVRIVTDTTSRQVGPADPVTITGPIDEIVLWLSGRDAPGVNADASTAEVDSLHARLKV